MKTVLILCFIVVSVLSRDYPMYKQCDYQWGTHSIGKSSTQNICSAGGILCSMAMGLAGTGYKYNPITLDAWLLKNDGYVGDCILAWSSMDKLAMIWKGWIDNSDIKHNLDAGNLVIVNFLKGPHYALATHYSDNTIYVNNPQFNTDSYKLSDIVDGNTVVFTPTLLPAQISQTGKEGVNSAQGMKQEVVGTAQKFLSTDDKVSITEIKTAEQ